MERGFKTRCEEMARTVRSGLRLAAYDPLPPGLLAGHLDVQIWSIECLGLSDEDIHQLTEVDPDSWSAITVSAAGREAIIVNPKHGGGRYSSDVMHELAHLMLRHRPSTMFFAGQENLALRGYDEALEEEANWLAGALLLPRDALVRVKLRRTPMESACETYGVSKQMLTFRLNVTGVARQFSRKGR